MPAEAIRINRRVLLQCSIGAPGLKQPFAQPQQNGALSAMPTFVCKAMLHEAMDDRFGETVSQR